MTTQLTSAQQLDLLINGFRTTPLLYAVARLGIADRIHAQPRTAAELAAESGVHAEALYRVLRTLSSLGIFVEDADERWSLTALAQPLRSDAPDSRHATAIMWGHPQYWNSYGTLLHTLETGQSGFEYVHRSGLFEYHETDSDSEQVFNNYMTERTGRDVGAIAASYDFTPFRTIVDIGGGHGAMLAAILHTTPESEGILFDQAVVLANAECFLATEHLRDRCTLIAGDFFTDALPTYGDVYLLKWIIHDWDDERALSILRRCRKYLPPHARLLLIEQVLRPANLEAYRTDIGMLVLTGGKERTETEYAGLLEAAGFRLERMFQTGSSFDILEATLDRTTKETIPNRGLGRSHR